MGPSREVAEGLPTLAAHTASSSLSFWVVTSIQDSTPPTHNILRGFSPWNPGCGGTVCLFTKGFSTLLISTPRHDSSKRLVTSNEEQILAKLFPTSAIFVESFTQGLWITFREYLWQKPVLLNPYAYLYLSHPVKASMSISNALSFFQPPSSGPASPHPWGPFLRQVSLPRCPTLSRILVVNPWVTILLGSHIRFASKMTVIK